MISQIPNQPGTLLDALAAALRQAAVCNRQDMGAPAAVLWTDKESHWRNLIPLLRELGLPVFSLGAYDPATGSGPAIWLRCAISGTLPEIKVPAEATPVLYLPGFSRQDLRAIEECPPQLKPLAELQYRGTIWSQKNGRDWTPLAFLESKEGGLGIAVAADDATKEALKRALLRLSGVAVDDIRRQAPVKASWLDALLNPDDARQLLDWIGAPKDFQMRLSEPEWGAFKSLCQQKYKFNPAEETNLGAAVRLASRKGPWQIAWERFKEAPASYPGLPAVLEKACPEAQLSMLAEWDEAWPQQNTAAECQLQQALNALKNKTATEARPAVLALEEKHAARRGWVWRQLDRAPLAVALEQLAKLARLAEKPLGGADLGSLIKSYSEWGWQVDRAVVEALAAVHLQGDLEAVCAAVAALYYEWLSDTAKTWQKAVDTSTGDYQPVALPDLPEGTCVLFSDALRLDIAQSLSGMLAAKGCVCQIETRLAALPTVTPTAKPAVSPVAAYLAGANTIELAPIIAKNKAKLTAESFRKLLDNTGWQVLKENETGSSDGHAWTEFGATDTYGHDHGIGIVRHVHDETKRLCNRVEDLLAAGWQRVVVVTDHGWLILPGGFPKTELPEHLTAVRKGRCARLKAEASAPAAMATVPWHWDKGVQIVMAPGITCFEAGKEYEHGGLSPQECIVPMLTVTMPVKGEATIKAHTWKGLRCTAEVTMGAGAVRVDIRTKAGDPTTSLVAGGKKPGKDGKVSLPVEDDEKQGSAGFIVVIDESGQVLAQALTTIGGD